MQAGLLMLSTALLIVSPLAYVVSILRGRSRPHRLTRLAVSAALLLSFGSAAAAHANTGTLVATGIFAAQSLLILGLSLWRGMGGTSVFDWICFVGALVGLVAWQVSGQGLVGLWFAILADTVAYLPAIVKTWRHPHTEGPWFYILTILGVGLGLAAYPLSASSVFQIYIILNCLAMLICIYHQKFASFVR